MKTTSQFLKAASTCVALTLGVAGCATAPMPIATQHRITRPDVGSVSTREVGEPLFEVEVATRFPGIILTNGPRIPGPFGSHFTFSTDQLPAYQGSAASGYCAPATMQPVVGLPSPVPLYCVTEAMLTKAGVAFSATTVTKNDPANFGQQLLYQGRSGSSLKLSYREFTGDMARPAFTQDLTFDLSEGPVIGTKGARVEVLEATNTSIRYKLLQPFSAR